MFCCSYSMLMCEQVCSFTHSTYNLSKHRADIRSFTSFKPKCQKLRGFDVNCQTMTSIHVMYPSICSVLCIQQFDNHEIANSMEYTIGHTTPQKYRVKRENSVNRVNSYTKWSERLLKVTQLNNNWLSLSKFYSILSKFWVNFTPFQVNFYSGLQSFPLFTKYWVLFFAVYQHVASDNNAKVHFKQITIYES